MKRNSQHRHSGESRGLCNVTPTKVGGQSIRLLDTGFRRYDNTCMPASAEATTIWRSIQAVFIALTLLQAVPVLAATSEWVGPDSNFDGNANWTAGVPTDVAVFNKANPLSINIFVINTLNEMTFVPGASPYTFTIHPSIGNLRLNGAGIFNNSQAAQKFINYGTFEFRNSAGAGNAVITNNSNLYFLGSSTADNAVIINRGIAVTRFSTNATAREATITNEAGGRTIFSSLSTAENVIITNRSAGSTTLFDSTSAGNAILTNDDGGITTFLSQSNAAHSIIFNNDTGLAIFKDNSSAGDATITNNGSHSRTSFTDSSNASQAVLINNGGEFDFSLTTAAHLTAGSIHGSGIFELGSNRLTVGSNPLDTAVSGVISGVGGSLVKVGTGTLTLSGVNTYTGQSTVQAGDLNVTGSLAGNALVESDGILSGSGSLGHLTNNAIVAPGVNGVGTLTADSYSGSGMLQINVNGSEATALRVVGNADLTGGALSLAGSSFAISHYDVLTAGSITGTFSTFEAPSLPSSLLLDLLYTPTNVMVIIRPALSFQSRGQNVNQDRIGAALDASIRYAGSNLATAMTALVQLPSAQNGVAALSASQVGGALDQMSGDSLAYFQGAGLRNAAVFTDQMQERMTVVTPAKAGVQSIDALDSGFRRNDGTLTGLWTQGVGFFDSIKEDSALGTPSAHATTGGFQVGYDTPLTDSLLVGLSGGYAKTNLSVDDRSMSGQSTLIQSGFYARYNPGSWFFNGSLAYGTGSNDSTRNISFPGVSEQAKGNFKSHVLITFIEGGYTFKPRERIELEPSLSFRKSHLKQEGFSESNAPALGLNVAEVTRDSLVSALGVSLKRSFLPKSSHPLTLGMNIAWLHEFADTENSITAQFVDAPGSDSFTVQGTPRSRNGVRLGLDSGLVVTQSIDLLANYSATLESGQTNQSLYGGFRVKW